jgi:hypothetical protein
MGGMALSMVAIVMNQSPFIVVEKTATSRIEQYV